MKNPYEPSEQLRKDVEEYADKTPAERRSEEAGECWWTFSAYNSEKLYGFGTRNEAQKYKDYLNRKREINHYYFAETDAETVSDLETRRNDGVNIADCDLSEDAE